MLINGTIQLFAALFTMGGSIAAGQLGKTFAAMLISDFAAAGTMVVAGDAGLPPVVVAALGMTAGVLAGKFSNDMLFGEVDDIARSVDDVVEKASGAGGFNINEIRPKLKTDPDAAFFWSGRTDGVGGADIAANVAKGKGGTTLESTIANKNIKMPEWDFNNPSSMEAWDLASGAYAEQVSGQVRAVVGSELRPGNIWENVELPRLKSNPKVTQITTIDPKTGIEKIIFERK